MSVGWFAGRYARRRRERRWERRRGAERLAGWWSRVVAFLIDTILTGLPGIVATLLLDTAVPPDSKLVNPDGSTTIVSAGKINWGLLLVVVLLNLVSIGLTVYDRYLLQGRTGRSWGKRVVGLRLVDEESGRPIGPGAAFARDVGHLIDCLPLFIGWFRPIWNRRKQTYADRLAGTVVLRDVRFLPGSG
jgi:uncharacterized RDD family membrane protein YckC